MKSRKHKQAISLLLLAVLSLPVFFPARAAGEVTVREILTDMGELVSVQKTPYVLAKERNGTLWGLYNTDGEELIPYAYTTLSYIVNNCFSAGKYLPEDIKITDANWWERFNSHALVTADGTQVSDFQYAVIKVFGTYWASGWVLEGSSEEDYDYKEGGLFYRIQRCDLYYLGDHALLGRKGTEKVPQPISLSRDEFKEAKEHGKFLYVQDREKKINVYDSEMRLTNVQVKKMDDPMYVVKNWAVVTKASGDILLDGISEVKEMSTEAGLYLKVTREDYSGVKWRSVYTVEGEQLMPFITEDISSVTADYAVLTANKKQGLYSFRENRQLLSCAFDKVIANEASLDPYVLHGYVCAERDGKRYYIHINDGTIIEGSELSKKWQAIGNTYVLDDSRDSRYRVLAPDQRESYVEDSTLVKDGNRGSGYLLSFTSQIYSNMIVTWYGERVIAFYYHPLKITDDDRVIVQTREDGFKLIQIVPAE